MATLAFALYSELPKAVPLAHTALFEFESHVWQVWVTVILMSQSVEPVSAIVRVPIVTINGLCPPLILCMIPTDPDSTEPWLRYLLWCLLLVSRPACDPLKQDAEQKSFQPRHHLLSWCGCRRVTAPTQPPSMLSLPAKLMLP